MEKTVRMVLMETDLEFVSVSQAFDGLCDVQDLMDSEFQWLDATFKQASVKYAKGTTKPVALVIDGIDWDFRNYDYSQE